MIELLRVINGDCLIEMPKLIASGELFDSAVMDPPYHLTSIVERFGKKDSAPNKFGTDGAFARASRGFMGKEWDGGDIAFRVETWRLVFDLLKPGAYLLAFSGTRTYHRMAVAIEDAGFEIRDQIGWLYGSGFPKSHDVRDNMIKAGMEQADDWEGWGTALKPAWEPIVVARKPFKGTLIANVAEHGTGALNIGESRIPLDGDYKSKPNGRPSQTGLADNYNPDLANTADDVGRWPANVIIDGSDEVVSAFPHTASGGKPSPGKTDGGVFEGRYKERSLVNHGVNRGSAARFFYSAKAQESDRMGSEHPTVKPLDLMSYLCRMVTPPGGHILDCFAGSGSTGIAGIREGFMVTLIEREAEYYRDIMNRLKHISGGDTPLFSMDDR